MDAVTNIGADNVNNSNVKDNNNTTLTENSNNNNLQNTRNANMTNIQNISYEDDFEKDTSSESNSQLQARLSDSRDSHNSSKGGEDSYEDDFEKDLSLDEKSKDSSFSKPSSSDDDDDKKRPTDNDRHASQDGPPPIDTNTEPPLLQSSNSNHMSEDAANVSGASDNESEDVDAYSFTEDQRRAMLELMVQKQEDVDLLDEEPPEYNVKGRLEQLNAELANSPAPVEGERETRVGFKAEIVDLVAPPQDFSDEDTSQPNSARQESSGSPFHSSGSNLSNSPKAKGDDDSGNADVRGEKDEKERVTEEKDEDRKSSNDPNKKQFVVERDGQFSVLSENELTPSEKAMLMPSESSDQKENLSGKNKPTNTVVPRPPSQPRPNTAAASTTSNRRGLVRQTGQTSPRPKSADHHEQQSQKRQGNDRLNWDFTYQSPYARSEEMREQSREYCKRQEQERKEKDEKKKREERQKREENDSAFQAWLQKKKDSQRKNADNQDDEKSKTHEEKLSQDEEASKAGLVTSKFNKKLETYEVIYPYLLRDQLPLPLERVHEIVKENEEAYKTWLKEKRSQGKMEKLLQRRQQQEQTEGYFMRPREECEKAFKEWLRKKNADLRRQHALDQQRSRMYRIQSRRSRKTQALVKALKESQAFRYVDYYGYRY